jgi:cytochrome c oxidase assembly protein subunit 15
MVAQAAVGYTQYFTHLPSLLVEVHLLGVTVLVLAAVKCFLESTYHGGEVVTVADPTVEMAPASVPVAAR